MAARYFKHKTINRFVVGRFTFNNHLLVIEDKDGDESNYQEFLREYEGLMGVDQVNIIEVLNIENERPVDAQRVFRGTLDSIQARDTSQGMVKASEMRNETTRQQLTDKEAELNARQAELDERERRLGLTQHAQANGEQAFQENGGLKTTDPKADQNAPATLDVKDASLNTVTGDTIIGKVTETQAEAGTATAETTVGDVLDNNGPTEPAPSDPEIAPIQPAPAADEEVEEKPGFRLGSGIKLNGV